MKIAIIGQAAFGKDVLNKLVGNGEAVTAVICPPDISNSYDPIKQAALEHEIPVYQFKRMRDRSAIDKFISLRIDLCVMAFVTDIIPMEILAAPTFGTIQYHPSLLPNHRGPSSINWPIIKGERETGLSIFWPDEGLDTGPILLQKEVEISPDDTLGSVYFGKLFPLGVDAMLEAVRLVKEEKAPKIDQHRSEGSYEGWCGAEEARIDWSQPASDIYNLIRGCDPSPGANTTYRGNRISFFNASYTNAQIPGFENGTVISVNEDHFKVKAEDGCLNIGRVRYSKGSKLSIADFVEKHGIKKGSTFPS